MKNSSVTGVLWGSLYCEVPCVGPKLGYLHYKDEPREAFGPHYAKQSFPLLLSFPCQSLKRYNSYLEDHEHTRGIFKYWFAVLSILLPPTQCARAIQAAAYYYKLQGTGIPQTPEMNKDVV